MNKKVCFFKVLVDHCKNLSCATWLTYFIIILITIFLTYTSCIKTFPEIVPCFCTLLGFTIACYSFIINLKENIIEKLSEQADNSKTPLNVLFSTLTLSIIFQVITIIFAYLNTSANSNVITYIINSFALLSLFSLFDIALNLFCIHTYFKK